MGDCDLRSYNIIFMKVRIEAELEAAGEVLSFDPDGLIENELHHTAARDTKLKPLRRKSFRTTQIERALGFQGSTFEPQRKASLYDQAFRAVTLSNHLNGNTSLARLAGRLSHHDPRHREFWIGIKRPFRTQSATLSLGEIPHYLKSPSYKEKILLDDPFLERLFENRGEVLKDLAVRLTEQPVEDLDVFFAGTRIIYEDPRIRPRTEMQPLIGKYDVRHKGLRYSGLNALYARSYRDWITSKNIQDMNTTVQFVQVRNREGVVLLSLDFTPKGNGFRFDPKAGANENYEGRMELSGELRAEWFGRGRIVRKDKKTPLMRKLFTRETSKEPQASEGKPGNGKLPKKGGNFMRVLHKDGHSAQYPHRVSVAGVPSI